MKRCDFVLTALVLLLSFCAHSRNITQGQTKPNVILIMVDDVSWEAFGCYGSEEYNTPNIDKMASEGVQFNHCYSTPICTPSRVMIMTGKYNFRNYTHFGYLNPAEKTFGNLMRENGYKTAIAGKWQLNGLYNKLEGHDDDTRPNQAGFDEYCLWQLTKMATEGGERFWSPAIESNGKYRGPKENYGKYGPDLFCEFLCDFMAKNASEPFFAYYPMVLVHNPFVPTPRTIGNRSRGPEANKMEKDKKKNFIAMVSYTDEIVGRLIAKTEDLGIAENTLIIFTADNGTNKAITSNWKGQSIKGGKAETKDMGTHVPLIAYWKGRIEKRTTNTVVDFTDIYPTLANVIGSKLDISDPIDGSSLLSVIGGKGTSRRDAALCYYQPYWNKTPGQFARNSNYKLYRDGRFYQPSLDLYESKDLSESLNTKERKKAYKKLKKIVESMPPLPEGKLGRETKKRPVYPDWEL